MIHICQLFQRLRPVGQVFIQPQGRRQHTGQRTVPGIIGVPQAPCTIPQSFHGIRLQQVQQLFSAFPLRHFRQHPQRQIYIQRRDGGVFILCTGEKGFCGKAGECGSAVCIAFRLLPLCLFFIFPCVIQLLITSRIPFFVFRTVFLLIGIRCHFWIYSSFQYDRRLCSTAAGESQQTGCQKCGNPQQSFQHTTLLPIGDFH